MARLSCCQSIVVCLSFVDLVLGAFFLFSGLWILLDWKIHELWVWLPFVIIGGLLMFTTFLSVCGTCASKYFSCCLNVSSPLVLVICAMECALGLAILFAWKQVNHYLDEFDHKIDHNDNGSAAGNDLIDEQERAYSVGASHLNPHDVHAVKEEVKEDHVIIAYVLFALSFLQLVRLLAAWCVNRRKRTRHASSHPQSWLYGDDGDSSLSDAQRVHDGFRQKYADLGARSDEAKNRRSAQKEPLLPGRGGTRTSVGRFQRDTTTEIIDLTPNKCAIM